MRFFSSLQVPNEDGGAELTVRRSSSIAPSPLCPGGGGEGVVNGILLNLSLLLLLGRLLSILLHTLVKHTDTDTQRHTHSYTRGFLARPGV